MDCQKVYTNIINKFSDYIVDNNLKSVVVGISGGIDSALISEFCYQISRRHNIPFIGRSIPIQTNKHEEIERAKNVGIAFCSDFKENDLTLKYLSIKETIIDSDNSFKNETETEYKIRCGNFKARLRMCMLYDLAQRSNGLVISTDNYTEFALGFWTLHGDVGDIAPIIGLKKTEVFELTKWLAEMYSGVDALKSKALMDCVLATPTDGLGITNSDVEQLGAKDYSEVDSVLDEYFSGSSINHKVITQHEKTHYKRNNPFNFTRSMIGLKEDWNI